MAAPRAGSLPGTMSSAGDELGWLVTSRKLREEVVDAVVVVGNLEVVDAVAPAGGSPPAFMLPVCLRGAMVQTKTGLTAKEGLAVA